MKTEWNRLYNCLEAADLCLLYRRACRIQRRRRRRWRLLLRLAAFARSPLRRFPVTLGVLHLVCFLLTLVLIGPLQAPPILILVTFMASLASAITLYSLAIILISQIALAHRSSTGRWLGA